MKENSGLGLASLCQALVGRTVVRSWAQETSWQPCVLWPAGCMVLQALSAILCAGCAGRAEFRPSTGQPGTVLVTAPVGRTVVRSWPQETGWQSCAPVTSQCRKPASDQLVCRLCLRRRTQALHWPAWAERSWGAWSCATGPRRTGGGKPTWPTTPPHAATACCASPASCCCALCHPCKVLQ